MPPTDDLGAGGPHSPKAFVEKEWLAVDDDEKVVQRADTRRALRDELWNQGLNPDDYAIVAAPKTHGGLWV